MLFLIFKKPIVRLKGKREKGLILRPEILIKMDVQGFEDRVISGGIATFRKAKAVITEVNFANLYEEQLSFDVLYRMLKDLGFNYRGSIYTKFHPNSGSSLFSDAIFIRK